MDGNIIIRGIWAFMNSGIGYFMLATSTLAFFVFLASRANPLQEQWKKYEGSIITGIKLAEKQIPNDTPNAGLAKLDAALRFVLEAYAQANNGKQPSTELAESFKQAIQVKHSELDRFGGLSKKAWPS